jgi:ribosomal protein L37E
MPSTDVRDHDLCARCGARTLERHCKIVCPRCGYTRDCTDP